MSESTHNGFSPEGERSKETPESFIARIEKRTGLKVNRIPDSPPEVMLGGAIIASSPDGTLVYTDHSHQEEDGNDVYNKAVLVERSKNIPPADADADGILS